MSGYTPPGSQPPGGPQPGQFGPYGAQGAQHTPDQSAGQPGPQGGSEQPGPYGQPAQPGQPQHPDQSGAAGGAGYGAAFGAQPPTGGPGGPYGPGGSGGSGGPGGPNGPGGDGSGGSGPGKGVIFGIIGGVVGLVIIVVIVLVLMLSGGDDDSGGEAGGGGENGGSEGGDDGGDSAEDAQTAPDSAVEAYLDALAEGDAETALSLIEEPSDTTHMTDEVLAASIEAAPISGIEVTPVDAGENDYAKEVTADYTVGEEDVTERFQVYNEEGVWAIQGSTSLGLPDAGDLPVTVNGVEATADDAYVFVGPAYTLAIDHENFTLEGGEQMLPESGYYSAAETTVSLSENGLERWRKAVSDAVDECVSSDERNAGCGLDVGQQVEGYDVVQGSVERSLTSSVEEEIASIEPQLDWNSPNLASSYISGSVETTAEIRAGGGIQRHEILGEPSYFDDPVVDMTAEELEVTWE